MQCLQCYDSTINRHPLHQCSPSSFPAQLSNLQFMTILTIYCIQAAFAQRLKVRAEGVPKPSRKDVPMDCTTEETFGEAEREGATCFGYLEFVKGNYTHYNTDIQNTIIYYLVHDGTQRIQTQLLYRISASYEVCPVWDQVQCPWHRWSTVELWRSMALQSRLMHLMQRCVMSRFSGRSIPHWFSAVLSCQLLGMFFYLRYREWTIAS